MSSNVGLSTPRGSGTSGYVQRNWAFMKPRNAGYGAPYPPIARDDDSSTGKGFRHRQPDKKILEHDRRRRIEVRVMEERERLEEENERLEENEGRTAKQDKAADGNGKGKAGKVLSEEEIEQRCEELREKLLKELERDEEEGTVGSGGAAGGGGGGRKGFKSYQVHELAEAKIEESERLRKALGITEDKETGEISSRDPRRRRQLPQQREWDRD